MRRTTVGCRPTLASTAPAWRPLRGECDGPSGSSSGTRRGRAQIQTRKPAAGGADPADAPAPDAAQPRRHAGHRAGGDLRDGLRRHPRHHAACRHRPRLPHGHADADAVGRRHGGRRLLRHQPGAGCRRRSPRGGLALHATVIGVATGSTFSLLFVAFGPAIFQALGGRGPVLAARAHLRERGAGGRGADLAAQHAGLDRARHRQHARALADAARGRVAADRSRRRTGARPRTDPALRPRRRSLWPGDRLRGRRAVPALVPAVRPGARDAEVQGHQPDARYVLRHPEGRAPLPPSRRCRRC